MKASLSGTSRGSFAGTSGQTFLNCAGRLVARWMLRETLHNASPEEKRPKLLMELFKL
jgi:hypothetical protein